MNIILNILLFMIVATIATAFVAATIDFCVLMAADRKAKKIKSKTIVLTSNIH